MYYFGPIPPGLWILHKCDNRLCVNPEHLYAGTRRDNSNDVITRGRLRGSKNTHSILNENMILEIIEGIKNNTLRSHQQIALKYKVTDTNIRHILKRKLWKHVTANISDQELFSMRQKLGSYT